MNMLELHFRSRMPASRSIEDRLSLAHLVTELGINNVTGNEDDIKKNYETHRQFFVAVGENCLVSAFKEYVKTATGQLAEVEKTKEGAVHLVNEFLASSKFRYWHDSNRVCDEYYDDMEKNCVDIGSRTLQLLILEQVGKAGDGQGLRAAKLSLVPFMLNRSSAQTSKYARWLVTDFIDFARLSDRDKWRVDRYCSVNTSGKAGESVPHDMSNEHLVGNLKSIISNMWAKLSMHQLEKSVLGLNVMTLVKELDREVMGMPVGTGGGHWTQKITEEQKEELLELFEAEMPFNTKPAEEGGRDIVTYEDQPDMNAWWEGKSERVSTSGSTIVYEDNLSIYNKERFIERVKKSYVKSRRSRAF
jgi:hypothetical protein